MDRWLYQLIILTTLVVWVGNFAARIVIDGYDPPQMLDMIFGVIAGGALTLYREQLRREWGRLSGRGDDTGGDDDAEDGHDRPG